MDQDSPAVPTSDSTLDQIHSLSKEKETDPTREQIRKYSSFSMSEALGLPLLSKDSAPVSWLGMPTKPKEPGAAPARPMASLFDGFNSSMFGNGGKSYFYWLTETDKKMIYAAAAVILLPLLGGFLFSR